MVLSSAKKVGTGLVKSANHKRKPYCSTAFIIIRQRRRKIVGQMLKIWILKREGNLLFPLLHFFKVFCGKSCNLSRGIVSPMTNSFLSSNALILCKNDFNTGCPRNFEISNLLGSWVMSNIHWAFEVIHSVWKSQKKSHSTLRAERATFTFWVDKS